MLALAIFGNLLIRAEQFRSQHGDDGDALVGVAVIDGLDAHADSGLASRMAQLIDCEHPRMQWIVSTLSSAMVTQINKRPMFVVDR